MTSTLADMKAGQSATVTGFARDDQNSARLMQLGVIDGVSVEVIRRAPTGDPIEIRVLGYALSLRASEAEAVLVSPEAPA